MLTICTGVMMMLARDDPRRGGPEVGVGPQWRAGARPRRDRVRTPLHGRRRSFANGVRMLFRGSTRHRPGVEGWTCAALDGRTTAGVSATIGKHDI